MDFYQILQKETQNIGGNDIVELGSGGGFIKEVLPTAITSEVIAIPNVNKVFSALAMPFAAESIAAFVMIDVLHHLPDGEKFFQEAARCLVKGGKIVMIEPANTFFSRIIYKYFHHEKFDTTAGWGTGEKSSPLSIGKGAIPWIIFQRDRTIFTQKYPRLKIHKIEKHTPFRYLLSGGLSFQQLVPTFSFKIITGLEKILKPVMGTLAMFQTIVIEKR